MVRLPDNKDGEIALCGIVFSLLEVGVRRDFVGRRDPASAGIGVWRLVAHALTNCDTTTRRLGHLRLLITILNRSSADVDM